MTEASIGIRTATLDDAGRLSALGRRAFVDAFGADNRPEDMAAYLGATYTIERQQAELADPDWTTLLAETGPEPMAYAQLRSGATPPCVAGPAPLELVRFYVDRRWHGSGVAHTLMAHVVAVARERGARTLWLAVWQQNPRAIAFYRKHGFREMGEQPFRLGADLQTDWIMARPLDAGPPER
jgi:ribosomal protein S18 acetylase RimI-like enzyme